MSFRISVFAALGLLATFSACSESETLPFTQYGEALTITETTAIADILADPEAYVGEQLRVEGTVVEVCQQMGCWMAVTAENSVDPLRVKVEDGVIVFPQTAVGHQEQGVEFDPASVTGPAVVYQLRGLGAEIEDPPAPAT